MIISPAGADCQEKTMPARKSSAIMKYRGGNLFLQKKVIPHTPFQKKLIF